MKKLRVLVLMHDYQVPPADVTGVDLATASWKTEYDVLTTVRDQLEHDVQHKVLDGKKHVNSGVILAHAPQITVRLILVSI